MGIYGVILSIFVCRCDGYGGLDCSLGHILKKFVTVAVVCRCILRSTGVGLHIVC